MVPGIPWEDPCRWREAQWALGRLALRYRKRLAGCRCLAADLRERIRGLIPAMEALGRVTCAGCLPPCCKTARVWFDFRDLLLYRLTDVPMPPVQPTGSGGGGCRYLTATGCALDRIARPWICTWYLCPEQKRALPETGPVSRRSVLSEIDGIGRGRKRLEAEFLEVVTGQLSASVPLLLDPPFGSDS